MAIQGRSDVVVFHLDLPSMVPDYLTIVEAGRTDSWHLSRVIWRIPRAKAIEYEEYLKRVAELAKRVEAGQATEMPETLNTPGKRALFSNLNQNEELALRVDETVKNARPDDWRGVQTKERAIKAALYKVLQDSAKVERIFLIIKAQKEY